MSYKGFVGSGTVGHFLTTTDLQTRFPADQYAGRRATVEVVSGTATQYFSNGDTWEAVPTLSTNPLTGGLALVGPDGVLQEFGSGIGASKTFGVGSGGTAIGAGTTLVTQHPAEFPFVGVQLLYSNQSGSPITVTKARVASTPVHQDIASTASWLDATFGGSASGVVPASPGGSASDTLSGWLLSDYVPCLGVARTDDTAKTPLLQARSYFAAAANGMSTSAGEIAAWNVGPAAFGRQYAARAPAGDQTATFTASQQPLEAGTWVVPTAILFHYPTTVKTICTVGDSLTKGHLTTGGATSWPAILAGSLRQAGKRFASNNMAWTGQKQITSMAVAKQMIQQAKPDYLAFFGWSPNDALAASVVQATFDEGYSRAVELVNYCRKNGVIPIICTSGPYEALNSTQNAMRRANNDRLKALGTLVYDFSTTLENPLDTTKIKDAYDAGDGLHYNDAGHAAMAAVAFAVPLA